MRATIPESHTYTHVIGIGYLPKTPKRSLFFLMACHTLHHIPLSLVRDHGDFPHRLRPPCVTSPSSPRLSLLCWCISLMLGFSFCRIRPWTAEDALNKRELLAANNNNNNKKRNSIVGNDCMVSNLSIGATRKKKPKVRKKLREPRFCFKTMSDVDVLDDGYKWRKYGQKVVKDTQHPRYICNKLT
ncbi:hypothetical protein GW17_00032610 [Ensete ventricosum]|nr:hypothetical protein GW17_00032610 [Ensete ventricosum]